MGIELLGNLVAEFDDLLEEFGFDLIGEVGAVDDVDLAAETGILDIGVPEGLEIREFVGVCVDLAQGEFKFA